MFYAPRLDRQSLEVGMAGDVARLDQQRVELAQQQFDTPLAQRQREIPCKRRFHRLRREQTGGIDGDDGTFDCRAGFGDLARVGVECRSRRRRVGCGRRAIQRLLSRLVALLVEQSRSGLLLGECDLRGRQRRTKHGEANAPGEYAPCSPVILILHKAVIVCECDRGDRASDHADRHGVVTRCFPNSGVSPNERPVSGAVVSVRWPRVCENARICASPSFRAF